jgi:hypothetical protein
MRKKKNTQTTVTSEAAMVKEPIYIVGGNVN